MNASDAIFRMPPTPNTSAPTLEDTQARPDDRHLAIQRVGIKALRHPVRVAGGDGQDPQPTVATFAMYVGLAEDVKGTHMSRFSQMLSELSEALSPKRFIAMGQAMQARLEAQNAYLEMRFPYFRTKTAPVSGAQSLLDSEVAFIVETRTGHVPKFTIEVVAPVTSLCPCSKKISDYGAHNQRTHITIRAEAGEGASVESLIEIAEAQASSQLYAVLKRPDEKFVTERAYDNPKFVEDLVRDVALACQTHPRVGEFTVASENFESIHNHSAYAEIHGRGRLHVQS
jgi:GTP cyclohydrolase IB